MIRLRRWIERLETPVDSASLAVFRIVFGLAVAVDAWRYLAYGWVDVLYVRPTMHFHYLGFAWVQPWPGTGMHWHFWGISVLGVLVAAGLFYRAAAVLLFAAYLYVFLLDQAAYMNHHYLMLLIAGLLACMPPAALASSRGHVQATPLWTVWILRFQLVLVYLYGAIAKLDFDWLRGEPMRSTLERTINDYPAIVGSIGAPTLAYAVAYLGLIADLAIPACLLFRPTRWLGLATAVLFHGGNALALDIGVFSYLMLGMLPIFFEPDWPRRWLAVFGQREQGGRTMPAGARATSPLLLALLHVYVAIQILVPLRHWLYPGPVSWTEEGHRFSWRMMLRTKRSEISLRVTDPATGRSWSINPANDLTSVQLRELETYPDLVLQYAHAHRDRLRREGIDPEIRANWLCSLNGRPQQPLADPAIDLAKTRRDLWPAGWILPLRTR